MLTKDKIITQLKRLSDFAEDNLGQLGGKLEEGSEIQDFYLGYIRRQSYFAIDLISIFENSPHDNFITKFIISRCIVDDYLHLIYILNQNDVNEAIVSLNADAYKRNFDKYSELADIKETILGVDDLDPYYPTYQDRDKQKQKWQTDPKLTHYFNDISNFKFKTFKQTGNFIKEFPKDQYGAKVRRAYYWWRHLSDYIHYTNFSFQLESKPENKENALNILQEIIYHSYKIVKLSFKYFQDNLELTLIDKHNLQKVYRKPDNEREFNE
jgi:hypothetical protein